MSLRAERSSPHLAGGQVETLRELIYGFHHDLSHLITALGRGKFWWAAGQLEVLRGMCVSLASLEYNHPLHLLQKFKFGI